MNIYSPQNTPKNFYIYCYIRITDGTPYYIGKGLGKRAWANHSSGKISVPKDKQRIIIMESNLTELGAWALERRYIRWFGRKDTQTGILYNKTDGGEGLIGQVHTEETKRKISESHKGEKAYWHGKKFTEEHKDRIRQTLRTKKLPEEHKEKIRQSLLGRKHSEETKRKISEIITNKYRDAKKNKTNII
jgi:hypothetical protein